MKKMMKKNVIAAALSVALMGGSFGSFCHAAEPTSYTDYVDMDVCYTGAIIDCRGLGLSTAMSPVIEDTTGQKIYGDKDLNPDVVIKKGMASYAHSFDDAAVARAGKNPIILKAVGVTNHGMYPVVEETDGELLHYSTIRNNYFKNAAVVFIR